MGTDNKQNFTIPIIVMFLLFGMISFVTNLASPMGDILKHQFSIPNWQGTLGVFANFIAYAVMGIPAGSLLQKKGYKKTALIAIAIGFIGVGIQTLSGVAASFGVYLIGAFIAGFSMCLLNTVVNPMLNKLGGGGNKGNRLIQFGGTFNSLCGTAVIVITGLLIPEIAKARISDVYPLMFTALAIFAAAFIVIALTRIPENEKTSDNVVESDKSGKGPMAYRHFVLGIIAIFIYVGVEVGVPNVLNKWLQNPEINLLGNGAEAIAASVAAMYWFLMLCGRLIGGIIASKVSARAMLSVVSCLALGLVLAAMFIPVGNNMVLFPGFNGANGFGMVSIPLNAALLACIGLCTSVMWGGIFNLAVEGLGQYTEKASGIFMAMVCGGGILPLLQNFIVDEIGAEGYLPSYWVIVAGVAYILFYAVSGSRIKATK